MKERLHRIDLTKGQDQITAEYTTACGIRGRWYLGKEVFPEGAGDALVCEGQKVWLARNFAIITCPRCKVRLTPAQKKILRAMLDYNRPAIVKEGPRVEWRTEGPFTLWAPAASILSLRRLGLVAVLKVDHKLILKGNGRLLAAGVKT